MDYFANPAAFQKSFNVPHTVAEKHLKLASPTQLRVLLYVCSTLSDDPSNGDIAAALSLTDSDVADALGYWQSAGIFISKASIAPAPQKQETKRVVKARAIKPSRAEVARRADDEKITTLLNEAQLQFGRELNFAETSTLVWLYDDHGWELSLIFTLIEYAKSIEKLNIGFIERTAVEWMNNGVDSMESAEKYIITSFENQTIWNIVIASFGIEYHRPSEKELAYARLWINEWKLPNDFLRAAYDECVNKKSKFVMSYTAKILEGWHAKGYKTLEEIQQAEDLKTKSKTPPKSIAGYKKEDLNKFFG